MEHLLKHAEQLPVLKKTGCLFVVSAVESLDDETLLKLEKHHTRADFLQVVENCRRADITLQPTFVPFTPWTTFEQILDLFAQLHRLQLFEAVAPIQLAIRLLIPESSRLLELPEIRRQVGAFDSSALVYPWANAIPEVDRLCEGLQEIAAEGEQQKSSRLETFGRMWRAVSAAANRMEAFPQLPLLASRATVPYLNEPWYC